MAVQSKNAVKTTFGDCSGRGFFFERLLSFGYTNHNVR